MKIFKTSMFILAIGLSCSINAQKSDVNAKLEAETSIDKKSYYQKRAAEDAKYEQQFNAENKKEEEAFWKEQKDYEKELKRNDRKAHKAYMKGKRDAYAEHYEHCDSHCHHGYHYYNHASFYYYGYHGYNHNRRSNSRTTINTRARISTPRVSLGLGI